MRKQHVVSNPKVTIQESIYNCHGMGLSPCQREKDNYCPENDMRQIHAVSSFTSCPWVMTICGYLSFHTLDDIPYKVYFLKPSIMSGKATLLKPAMIC